MSPGPYLPSFEDTKSPSAGFRKSHMKSRGARRPILITLFCICLLILFYQQFTPSSSQSSPQRPINPTIPTRIDFPATSSPSAAPAPAQARPELEVVVASLAKENTTWLSTFFPSWPLHIYVVDDPSAALTVPKNKGHESMVYLTYIISHYDSLPPLLLFLHATRYQWHNDNPDYDGLPLLRNLQLPYVRAQGYVNLRCVWVLGCPTEIRPFEDLGSEDKNKATAAAYKAAFEELFPGEPVPEKVGVTCCAQFAASREAIRGRSKEEYVRWREWLLATELEDEKSGRVFEYSWHMIFGKDPVHCPKAKDCYCKVFGLCDLKCDDGACDGQYTLPQYATLPKGWPLVGWDGEPRAFEGTP